MWSNFSWSDHTRTRVDQGGERPTPSNTRPNTGEDPAQVSRIEPPSRDGPSPSTKTGPVSLPVAKPPEEREGLTRGTNASSDATARSASEDDREEPATRAKPGDQESPAKAELGESPKHKSSPLLSGISRLAPETEKPCRPRYRWSYQDTSQSARARDPTSSRYHNPEGATKREKRLDGLLGLLLRGGEDQPVVQIPEKSDPMGACPS